MPSPSVTASTNFNSRPSARGDPHGTNLPNSFFISIHAPPRGATHFVSSYGSVLQFQFTPLREGRPADKANHNLPALFQFTPLREGRRAAAAQSSAAINISIHAPPRGATSDAGRSLQSSNISIHAPPRGATITCERRYPISNISIHAPPRGATLYGTQFEELHVHFNSRPSARGDRLSAADGSGDDISIHAPPRGATIASVR